MYLASYKLVPGTIIVTPIINGWMQFVCESYDDIDVSISVCFCVCARVRMYV